MPDRNAILSLIDQAYAARMAGDHAAMADYWEPDAVFRIAGRTDLIGDVPHGEADAQANVEKMIALFRFHDLERLQSTIEGDSAVIHWRLRVSAGDGDPVDTEILDLWRITPDGKLASLVQFADTALMAHMLRGTSG